MDIRFCGASSGVTGSCHYITSKNHQVLLDCGQYQGGKTEEALNFGDFCFDPKEIECVILSHPHIDHCGRIPLLVKRGFKGPIYCTDATADLLDVMLKDSAYIHEREAEWKNEKLKRAGKTELLKPLYTIDDALDSLLMVKPVLYDELVEINEDMKIVFNEAGHILGSAIVELWVDDREPKGENILKLVYTGDLGAKDRPILRDPKYIKKADYLIMEATYGNRLHPENATSVDELLSIVLKTVKRGGNVIIPSFAVGRTQELIYQFNRFYEDHPEARKALDDVMVYVDSPMAKTATEVFRRNVQVFDEETRAYILRGDNPLDFKNLKFTRSVEESRFLNTDTAPKVIISASGMCEAGRIRHHLKHNIWKGKNSIVFVGYQAEGTLGRKILDGAKEITLFGDKIYVNAEIYDLEGFSGHADRDGLLDWLSGLVKEPKKIFLVHGEMQAKIDFAEYVKEKLGYTCKVVKTDSIYHLDSDEFQTVEETWEDMVDKEGFEEIKDRVDKVLEALEDAALEPNLKIGKEFDHQRVADIKNLLLALEKDAINLRSLVGEKHDNTMDLPKETEKI